MTDDVRAQQCREWTLLYDAIGAILRQFGKEDDGGEWKDYLLVEDNLGLWQHRIETSNPEMMRPAVVKLLQKSLIGYPDWEIVIAASSLGGLVIRDDEIIDGLRRENLPKEFQTIEYEGSRPQGSRFGDVVYSGGKPF
jgi:hypothetical protein